MTTEITQSECSMEKLERCSGVLCDRRMPVKLKSLQNCGQTSSVVWCSDLGNNERTRRSTRSK